MKERATPLDVEHDPKEREEAVSRAKAIVTATTHYNDPKILAEVSEQVTGTMKGLRRGRARRIAAAANPRLVDTSRSGKRSLFARMTILNWTTPCPSLLLAAGSPPASNSSRPPHRRWFAHNYAHRCTMFVGSAGFREPRGKR